MLSAVVPLLAAPQMIIGRLFLVIDLPPQALPGLSVMRRTGFYTCGYREGDRRHKLLVVAIRSLQGGR